MRFYAERSGPCRLYLTESGPGRVVSGVGDGMDVGVSVWRCATLLKTNHKDWLVLPVDRGVPPLYNIVKTNKGANAPKKEANTMKTVTAERLDMLTYIGGSVDVEGERYYGIQMAYIDGINDDIYYQARVIKAAEALSGEEKIPVYNMYWVPVWAGEEDVDEEYYEDETRACDWDNPYKIKECDSITIDELDELIERNLPSYMRRK